MESLTINPVEELLPVVDFSRLLDPEYSLHESAKLDFACKNWGFFQLINHGVASELLAKLTADCSAFFKLPLDEKEVHTPKEKSIEGYYHSIVTTGKEFFGEKLVIEIQPRTAESFIYQLDEPFRDTVEKYSVELKQVAYGLLRAIMKNLGCEPEFFFNKFGDMGQFIRVNLYTPYNKSEEIFGLYPHSDVSLLTLLLQANDVHGLQIRKNGEWFPAKPLAGALLINVGDSLEILSNGIYKSIEHRVIINPEKERMSAALFFTPELETEIAPLSEIVKGDKQIYKNVKFGDYLKGFMFSTRNGKRHLDMIKY